MKAEPNEPLILVDEQRRQAFVSIAKVASTSMLVAWQTLLGLDPEPVHARRWPKTASRAWLAEHPEYFRWAVVRDPRDRLASLWSDKIRSPSIRDRVGLMRNPELATAFGLSFRCFLCYLDEYIVVGADHTDRHLQSQAWHVTWEGGLVVDRLIRLEELPTAWPDMQQRFGFPELPRRNASRRQADRETLDLAGERIVRRVYAEDFHLLGIDPCEP